jgi:hypothetical protein
MRIKPISSLLQDSNLKYPILAVLQPTKDLYTALLVQPKAHVQVRDDFIRNADRAEARTMFTAIAKEARLKSVQLLVTPEYSFPWEAIDDLFAAGVYPEAGQLWVLGCESLALADLDGLKSRFAQWADVMHETIPADQPPTVRYLDPLVYIFRTERLDTNDSRIAMVVQFKTEPSGDPENIEITRMARGEVVYLFERGNEVRLISILCSDAFGLSDELVDANYENLLLLHLQLNDKPRQEAYMRYRRRIYEFDCDRTEVVCLNWAENIAFNLADDAQPVTKINISASAWHSKSNRLATDDLFVEKNHRFGLYYTRDSDQLRHMLHFAYQPAAFLLQATKVRHHAVPAPMSRRRGPEVIKVLRWGGGGTEWIEDTESFDDGFEIMTGHYGAPATLLNLCHSKSPLAIERLSCITSGDFGPMPGWYEVEKLPTLSLESRTEVVRRISVTHDPGGREFREQRIRTISSLAHIPANTLPLPSRMKDILEGYQFDWNNASPHSNVKSTKDEIPAALIYAGESPSGERLKGLHAKVRATTSQTSLADRFCVLYREGQEVRIFDPPLDRLITGTDAHPGKNFMEPEK